MLTVTLAWTLRIHSAVPECVPPELASSHCQGLGTQGGTFVVRECFCEASMPTLSGVGGFYWECSGMLMESIVRVQALVFL